MTRKKLELMEDAPTETSERTKKNEGKTNICLRKKQERHRDAHPARAIRRLQKGSHMN